MTAQLTASQEELSSVSKYYKTESKVWNCSVCHLIHKDSLGSETSGCVVLCITVPSPRPSFTLDLSNPKKLNAERKL
jgi:hypothetical protein